MLSWIREFVDCHLKLAALAKDRDQWRERAERAERELQALRPAFPPHDLNVKR